MQESFNENDKYSNEQFILKHTTSIKIPRQELPL